MNYIVIIFIEKYYRHYSKRNYSMASIQNTIEIVQRSVQSLVGNILDITVQSIVHIIEKEI